MPEFERGLVISPGTDRQLGAYGLFRPAPSQQQALELPLHTLTAKSAAPDLLWVGFAELCGGPLESADYRALAARYPVWVIDGVPSPLVESDPESGAGSAGAWERFLEVLDRLREQDVIPFLVCRGPLDWAAPGLTDAHSERAAALARITDRLAGLRRLITDEELEDEQTGGC